MALTKIDYTPNIDGITLKVIANNGIKLDPSDPLMQDGGSLIQDNFIKIADSWNSGHRNVVFGINSNFAVQTASPLANPVQITKVSASTVDSGMGIVLTAPTDSATTFRVCKNTLAYDANKVVALFSVAITTGTVTTTLAGSGSLSGVTTDNLSLAYGDYLTIFCNTVGTTAGADGSFTLTII